MHAHPHLSVSPAKATENKPLTRNLLFVCLVLGLCMPKMRESELYSPPAHICLQDQ